MDKAAFLAAYGGIFEHSPWVAERAWDAGTTGGSAGELHAEFAKQVLQADRQEQLALLRAHPDLACAVAAGDELTAESRSEQGGAGLDQCSPAEFEEFSLLNRTYMNSFGFPFIIAVRGLDRGQILEEFRSRIGNSIEEEFSEALQQVIRIGRFRLHQLEQPGEAVHDG